jgi:hypothetical protein
MMDMKAAFPHVSKNRLANKMKQLEVPDYLIGWTLSWMEDRRAVLAIAGEEESEEFDINTGIPQGSPLSTVLFIIYIADVFEGIEISFKCKTVSFAEDCTVLVREKDPEKPAKEAEKIAQAIIQWDKENDVKFDTDKTELMFLTRKRKSSYKNKVVKIQGKEF